MLWSTFEGRPWVIHGKLRCKGSKLIPKPSIDFLCDYDQSLLTYFICCCYALYSCKTAHERRFTNRRNYAFLSTLSYCLDLCDVLTAYEADTSDTGPRDIESHSCSSTSATGRRSQELSLQFRKLGFKLA